MREEAGLEGRIPKPLVYVLPEDNLAKVVRTLFDHKCSMAPILSCALGGLPVPDVLHMATLSGIMACLMRHFRASLASLPLLAQPLGLLPIGTWSPSCQGLAELQETGAAGGGEGDGMGNGAVGGGGQRLRKVGRVVKQLHTVTPNTLLTNALSLLLDAGVSMCVRGGGQRGGGRGEGQCVWGVCVGRWGGGRGSVCRAVGRG